MTGRPPRTILLVEDDEDHADLIQYALSEAFPEIEVAWIDHGTRALEHLRGLAYGGALPDLVLLDLNLPGHGGVEILQRVRPEPWLDGVPIVVLTSSHAAEDRQAATDAGASAFLVKNFRMDELTAQLRATLGSVRSGGAS